MSDSCDRSGISRIFPQAVKRALDLAEFDSRQAQLFMAPRPRTFVRPPELTGNPKQAGVMLLLYLKDDELTIALTRRTETVVNHSGQISLPGGARDRSETLLEAALRETQEEVGVKLDTGSILGRLTPLYIPPSDYEIHPFVALYPRVPDFTPAPVEVAEIIDVRVVCLLEPAIHRQETWEIRGQQVEVPFYYLKGHKVWGATAMVLSEFEQRLHRMVEMDSNRKQEA